MEALTGESSSEVELKLSFGSWEQHEQVNQIIMETSAVDGFFSIFCCGVFIKSAQEIKFDLKLCIDEECTASQV